MSAFCMVFYPAEMLRFPSIHLIMNFVSSSFDYNNKFWRIFCFYSIELLPFVFDIVTRPLKTFSIVKGTGCLKFWKKWLIVFWPFLHLWAASPRSPVYLTRSLIIAVEDPHETATALVKIYLPIPN